MFQYPKDLHKRKLTPRQFKRYQSYKKYLQTEFERVCIYCRQPDSSVPNLNFGVDHYRPKGLSRFAKLICDYDNLYYCCGNCNSRKNNDWPSDEKIGPFVVNPCDHQMASHLRFDKKTGRVEYRTENGKHTEELLQLNDNATVTYRLATLTMVELYVKELGAQAVLKEQVLNKLQDGSINKDDYDQALLEIDETIGNLNHFVQAQTGELPLPPLKKQRLNVLLLTS